MWGEGSIQGTDLRFELVSERRKLAVKARGMIVLVGKDRVLLLCVRAVGFTYNASASAVGKCGTLLNLRSRRLKLSGESLALRVLLPKFHLLFDLRGLSGSCRIECARSRSASSASF